MLHDLGHAGVISPDHLAQVLGIRRADSAVDPTKSQNRIVSCRRSGLRDLFRTVRLGRSGRRCSLRLKAGDGGLELAPIANQHHAEILKVFSREFRQHVLIHGIVAECGLVPAEAKAAQPGSHVHSLPSQQT